MSNKLEVSFNSPQCGWMSVGFTDGENEFHTTTAYTPHVKALPEILEGLSSLLDDSSPRDEFAIAWSRNPEEYRLFFRRVEKNVFFQVVEFPASNHLSEEGEIVFSYQGSVKDFCESFYETFAQLYEDRNTDEFEFNWRQPFPVQEYEDFKRKFPTEKRELDD